jgi:hypothetical protein
MNADELKNYLDGRYSELINFYNRRAITAKRGHNWCSLYIILISVAIAPIQAVSLGDNKSDVGKILVAVLSPTLALVAGIAAHFKFHENWLSYRATWDALQRELALLKADAGSYRGVSNGNSLFVERVEAMVANEGKEFFSRHASKTHGAGVESTSTGGKSEN